MDEVMTTLPVLWKWVLGICGMIIAVGGACAIVAKLFAPIKRIEARLEALEKKHAHDQKENAEKLDKDHNDIHQLEASNRHICECMLALMDHEITGNSIERLKEARNSLNKFLINR